MMLTKTIHPPAGANPFIAILGAKGAGFIIIPVAAGAAFIVLFAITYNKLFNTVICIQYILQYEFYRIERALPKLNNSS